MHSVIDASGADIGSIEQTDTGLFRAFDVELRSLGIFESARLAADACLDAALNPAPIEPDNDALFAAVERNTSVLRRRRGRHMMDRAINAILFARFGSECWRSWRCGNEGKQAEASRVLPDRVTLQAGYAPAQITTRHAEI